MAFLQWSYGGNRVEAWLIAVGIALGVVVAMRLVRWLVTRYLRRLAARTTTTADDTVLAMVERTRTLPALTVGLHFGAHAVVLPARVERGIEIAMILGVALQLGLWATAGIRATFDTYRARKVAAGETAGLGPAGAVAALARGLAWVVVALMALGNLGVDVTALVAGLGIGGLAIALALQGVLQDLFSAVAIMLDKPFEVGDVIVVDGQTGTVESIGIKTVRLRALGGEQLVFNNSALLAARIANLRRMQERRLVIALGVTYDTPVDKLRAIPKIIEEIVTTLDDVRFDRAHLRTFGASSIDYEIAVYVTQPDFLTGANVQQAIHLALVERFAADAIEFAFPTRTVHVASLPATTAVARE
ncbi:MAG: mechanosensitive ion channel family protein [Kofleriaceae bacterium]